MTGAILDEYREVLSRPEVGIRKSLRSQFLRLLRARARTIKTPRSLRVTVDPDDNKFIECADAARADYLVTGNLRHFPESWKRTKVITSRGFLDAVAPYLIR